MTNDGVLANKILESDNLHEKEYIVTVNKDFDDEFYGLGPFIYVKGYFALLGYETDDEEILAKDIERVANGKKPTQDFSDRRFTVK